MISGQQSVAWVYKAQIELLFTQKLYSFGADNIIQNADFRFLQAWLYVVMDCFSRSDFKHF